VVADTADDIRAAVLKALAVLHEPGAVVELRVPNCPRRGAVISGYFTDHEALATQFLALDGQAAGIYVTLNQVNPALLARRQNRIETWCQTTTADADVLRRRWLLLDFDPVRPAGVSSTGAEHRAALQRANDVRDWLNEQSWPAPSWLTRATGIISCTPLTSPPTTAAL
jgi:hypothetical protein